MAIANPHPPPASQYQLQQQPSPPEASSLHSAQQRPESKPRKSRTFSFRSDKSRASGNQQKIDLHETSAEKEAKRLHSKADPRLAMQEAEPSEVAATVKSSLAPLRSVQHKDPYGNPIVDPDRSNPTRSRWERPLDTIRSFEAAIDGGHNNRRSIIRPDAEGASWGASRRASYYGGNPNGGRYTHDSYYGSRPNSLMYASRADASLPDLRTGAMGFRESYYEQQHGYAGYGHPAQNGRRGWPRMASEPQYSAPYRQQYPPNDYVLPSNHRSYETVTTASGSGSSAEPAGYQTDPTSSDNSSIERGQSVPLRRTEPVMDYGIGFGQSPSLQPPSLTMASLHSGHGSPYQTNGMYQHNNSPAPPVPRKDQGSMLRKPIAPSVSPQARPAQPEKRKSWFARRFSRHS